MNDYFPRLRALVLASNDPEAQEEFDGVLRLAETIMAHLVAFEGRLDLLEELRGEGESWKGEQ